MPRHHSADNQVHRGKARFPGSRDIDLTQLGLSLSKNRMKTFFVRALLLVDTPKTTLGMKDNMTEPIAATKVERETCPFLAYFM